MRKLILALALVAIMAGHVRGDGVQVAPGTPRVRVPLMESAPELDGRIVEDEWRGAVRNVGFVSHSNGLKTHRRATFWVGCDGERLLLAIKSETPPGGNLLTRATPQKSRDQRSAFQDDSIELAIDPARGSDGGGGRFYHLIVNARGALYDRAIDPGDPQNPVDFNWRIPEWTFENGVHDGWWHVEMGIPLESLGAGPEDLEHPWGVRMARNWKRPFEQSQWESRRVSYIDRPTMPVVRWDGAAPVVGVLRLHENQEEANIAVAVRNPHEEPLVARVRISDAWHNNQPSELDREFTVPAGGVEVVNLTARDGGPNGVHHTVIRVTDPAGRRVYYFRDYRWNLHRPESVWSIGEEEKKAVDLKMKYYPYHDKLRLRVNIAGMELRDRVRGAKARIRRYDRLGDLRERVLWSKEISFGADHVSQGIYGIPDLNNGEYRLSVHLRGGEGVPSEPVVQRFVRQHYEWEHNELGRSEEVMPPFTPLEVEGATVSAVLRDHTHGPAGLWESVTSRETALLTAPMKWHVEAVEDGEPAEHAVEGSGWKVISHEPTGVVGQARFTAGPLRAAVRGEYDYDGMLKVTLRLQPTGGKAVRRLSLDIPVVNDEAPYMHAVSDGLRHHYAGFVPEGEGEVWNSNEANKLDLVGTFYPYLWVGGGSRGLCWFADSDRGWVLDDETPVIRLIRRGDTLLMRVSFITRPGPITGPRQIVFGLQATPTKPMPEGWRRWTTRFSVAGSRNVAWSGATMYWGGTYYSLAPMSNRYEAFRELAEARRTGRKDPEFIDRWMSYVALRHPEGSKNYEKRLAHIRAGFHTASHSTWESGTRWFGYTNARGINFDAPPFETFQDEWLRFAWFHRNWTGGANAYDVSPSPSFVDFAVWRYRRMLDCFDGVYWDNTFMSPHYDPVVGAAWKDQDGTMHPGMGLWHMRELIKRTAIMHRQQGRDMPQNRLPLIQLSHMTNTMVVPVLSFGNCNMDWEWRYGYRDFQDRVSADLTVAQSIGRQVGAWGTVLGGGHPKPDDPRTAFMRRTRAGVCLVHEIQHWGRHPQWERDLYRKLYEFGYGREDCRVYNYWQKGHPVSVSGEGVDARTLVIARGGAAVVVLTSYGEGGECRVRLDRKKLALPAGATASDLESGKAVRRVGPGEFTFSLKKHDFKVLEVR